MRWLDWMIDFGYTNSPGWVGGALADLGPYGRVGSVVNVLVCAGIGVALVVTGLSGSAFGVAPALFAAALEVVFVRTCIRAFRGDFDLAADDEAP